MDMRHIKDLITMLDTKDTLLLKEVLRILCNVSNNELGKKLLMEYNVIPYLNKLLQSYTDPSIPKCAVACLSNIATSQDLKKSLIENHCLVHVVNVFQGRLKDLDTELVKYSLYFIGNICEDCPEAAYLLGKLKTIEYMGRFFNSKLTGELLGDGLDALYTLLQIKENLYVY
jgi:hypothetical protein